MPAGPLLQPSSFAATNPLIGVGLDQRLRKEAGHPLRDATGPVAVHEQDAKGMAA
jgi:hypothetical protein